MIELSNLKNTSIYRKPKKRVGRGMGSGKGKTSGRGHKGDGSRSGYGGRQAYEGGQMRLLQKTPIRGFNNKNFRREYDTVNLHQIESIFSDGDVVSKETLVNRGYISKKSQGIKILSEGELTKKVTIEANALSAKAKEKLTEAKIPFKVLSE